MKVTATRVASFEDAKNPGDFFWVGDPPSILQFLCPCGCGALAGTSVKPANPHGWDWNGDLDKPTVRPSILIDRNHWHGYLTDGVFESC